MQGVNDRQSGRTTRILQAALERHHETGRRVVFVYVYPPHYYRNLWVSLGGDTGSIHLMMPHSEFRGLDPADVFIDHHVFERGDLGESLTRLIRRPVVGGQVPRA